VEEHEAGKSQPCTSIRSGLTSLAAGCALSSETVSRSPAVPRHVRFCCQGTGLLWDAINGELKTRVLVREGSGAQVPKARCTALPLSYGRIKERPVGVEPTTCRLEADCTLLLSGHA
jgi:hypothetical protein